MTVLIKSDPDFFKLCVFYNFLLLVFNEHALGMGLFLYM
jgi:hypothetical protein